MLQHWSDREPDPPRGMPSLGWLFVAALVYWLITR